MTAHRPGPPAPQERDPAAAIARSAGQLLVRQVLVAGASAVATMVLARALGVASFGGYSAGLATYYLLSAGADFGLAMVLARGLGAGRADDGRLTRSVMQVQLALAALLSLVAIAIGVAAGVRTARGAVTLAVIPALLAQAWSPMRQVYLAGYRTRRLATIDVTTNLAQSLLVVVVAEAGGRPLVVACAFSLAAVANAGLVRWSGRRLIDRTPADRATRRGVLRQAIPLGLTSVLASTYLMLDLAVVGFLVGPVPVGHYAAAVKVLSILATVPGLVMTAAMAGVSGQAGGPDGAGELAARIWHWLAVTGLPCCALAGVFAPLITDILFGPQYRPAAVLLRILAGAAAVALLSNVVGTVMVAQHRARWLLAQNAAAVLLNLGGNLLLVPRIGIAAAAWLTLGTEVFVCAGSWLGLRGRWDPRPLTRISAAPVLAVAALCAIGLVVQRWSVLAAVPAAVAGFAVVLLRTRAWPAELAALLRRPHPAGAR